MIALADRIIFQQEAAAHSEIHDIKNHNFIRRKNFRARESSHYQLPSLKDPTTNIAEKSDKRLPTVSKVVCPVV